MDDFEYNDYKCRKFFNDLIVGCSFNILTKFDNNIHINNGPILFCGNHINSFDQFIVTSGTNIMIHWITDIDILNSKLGTACKLMKCIPNDENVKKISSNYLNIGSSIGVFPESMANKLSKKKINELYSELRSGMTYNDYEKLLRGENVKLSQINLLQKLFNDNKISELTYQKGLLSTELILFECIEKGIITKEEFDDALLLPFNDNLIDIYRDSNVSIMPFAITEDYYNSGDIEINFGDLLKINDIKENTSNVLRGKVLELVKKGEKRN